jgi:predicted amino acid racemase
VVGVTKGVCGDPAVAAAMVEAGVAGIGDSRVENLARLREERDVELTQLRLPMPSSAAEVVAVADRSLHSEVETIEQLGAEASRHGQIHDVILMVDMGDGREGVPPEQLTDLVADAVDCAGVSVAGVGTNFGCFGGVLPTPERLRAFVSVVEDAESVVDGRFDVVSGGSTAALPLAEDGSMPARVTELRVGEGMLLGTEATSGRRIPYLSRDGFELRAEVIECKRKPALESRASPTDEDGEPGSGSDGEDGEPGSGPDGGDSGPESGPDGGQSEPAPQKSGGRRERAVVALGSQDTDPSGLHPVADGIEVVGASSDHTVLDVTDAERGVGVGDEVGFHLEYAALVGAFTSPYVGRTVDRDA